MTANNVILESPSATPASGHANAAGEPVRPKAFRRPPGWVAPPASAPSADASPSPAARPPAPHLPRRDRLYGLFLIILVAGVNLVAALLLSIWQSHSKPRHSFSSPPTLSFEKAESVPQRDNVTIYASPPTERRMLRLDALDTPFDSTDAAWHPAADPADDQ